MNNSKRQKGQTVIEMALVILLLLMLLFGIAEIARAWWFKGQLNNAARVGVRVAVVTSPLTGSGGACSWSGGSCSSGGGSVAVAACKSITTQDLCNSANVQVTQTAVDPPAGIEGDEITVTVTGQFTSVVRGLSTDSNNGGWGSLFPGSTGLTGVSVMRHE
jgi:Flp pilus assembly protein TadG